ncbi:MAG: ParA family protein [Actinomycetia bacterium]|nr:ParA family protein [Actinomycetes bacterium]
MVPNVPGRARVIAIANQKGGVGKSTTAVSLGAALADIGYRVLVADLDPQGNASTGMGIRHDAREVTVYDVVVSEAEIQDAIVHTPVERLHAVPATIDLAGAEIELVSQFSRESRLKKAIEPVLEGAYDFILLDCPPSLGLLTINALTAAEELIVPIQCEYYALEGLGQLLRNVSLVQQNINSGLRLSGIVMTMFDPRTKLSEQVVAEVKRHFGDLVYDVIIPRTVRLSEAPGFGQPITIYDAKSKGAQAYRQLAQEVALRPPPEAPMPQFDKMPIAVMPPMERPEGAEGASGNGGHPEPSEEPRASRSDPMIERAAEREPVVDLTPEPAAPEPRPETAARQPEPESQPADPAPQVEMAASPTSSPPPARKASGTAVDADDDAWEEPARQPEPRVKPPSRPAPPGELPQRRVVVIDENSDIDIEAGQEAPPAPADEHREGMADIGATLDEELGRKRRWRMFRKGGD